MKPLNHAASLRKATGLPNGQIAHADAIVKIRDLLFKKVDPTTREERTQLLALAEHMAGESAVHVEKKYVLASNAIQRIIRKVFPSQESLLEFVEDTMLSNCLLAQQIFTEKAHEMTAIQAAQAAGIFANRVVEIKKARATNYKPEIIPVGLLLQLGEALRMSKMPVINAQPSA